MDEIKSILLAEDDPNDVELTLAALAEHNLANKVEVVRDGAEALDYLFRRGKFATRPDRNPVVVLLDLKMPKVNGLEVLHKIKTDEKLKTVPVVALTSSRESPDVKRCYDYGVNAYVVKPVGFEELVTVLRELKAFWLELNEAPPAEASESLKRAPLRKSRTTRRRKLVPNL